MTHRLIKNGELVLYGPVGMRFDNEGFSAMDVVEALAEMSGDIRVRLNSPGGFAGEGIAIHNSLRAHDGQVTTVVDGQALSAGAIIFAAGDERLVSTGALTMIHSSAGATVGTARDHAKSQEVLNKFDDAQARIFAKATKKRPDAMRRMLDAETWMSADEAVAKGFATGTTDGQAIEPMAFDYRVYAKAPAGLVAMCEAKRWPRLSDVLSAQQVDANFDAIKAMVEELIANPPVLAGDDPRGGAAHPPSPTENSMTEAEKIAADAKAAAEKIAAEKAHTEAVEKAKAEATAAAEAKANAEREAETARVAEIADLCKIAGADAKAGAFIKDKKSVAEVRAALLSDRAKADEVSARNGTASKPHDPEAAKAVNPNAIYAGREKARQERARA